jgi:hypothetical protein
VTLLTKSGEAMSNRLTDIEGLHREVMDAELTIIDLNRKLTGAIVSKRATGNLSVELERMIGTRDFMRERLKRLRGAAI